MSSSAKKARRSSRSCSIAAISIPKAAGTLKAMLPPLARMFSIEVAIPFGVGRPWSM